MAQSIIEPGPDSWWEKPAVTITSCAGIGFGAFIFTRRMRASSSFNSNQYYWDASEMIDICKEVNIDPDIIPAGIAKRTAFVRAVNALQGRNSTLEIYNIIAKANAPLGSGGRNKADITYTLLQEQYKCGAEGKQRIGFLPIGELSWSPQDSDHVICKLPDNPKLQLHIKLALEEDIKVLSGKVTFDDLTVFIRDYMATLPGVPARNDGRIYWVPQELIRKVSNELGRILFNSGMGISLVIIPCLEEHRTDIIDMFTEYFIDTSTEITKGIWQSAELAKTSPSPTVAGRAAAALNRRREEAKQLVAFFHHFIEPICQTHWTMMVNISTEVMHSLQLLLSDKWDKEYINQYETHGGWLTNEADVIAAAPQVMDAEVIAPPTEAPPSISLQLLERFMPPLPKINY